MSAKQHAASATDETSATREYDSMSTNLTLPLPPSTNRLWRAGRGRVYRSPRYDAWRKTAGWELVLQKPMRIAGPVTVTIAAGRPDRRRRDVDNLGKAVLDLLTAHRITADDSMVVKLTTAWDANVTPGTIRVTLEPTLVMACAKA